MGNNINRKANLENLICLSIIEMPGAHSSLVFARFALSHLHRFESNFKLQHVNINNYYYFYQNVANFANTSENRKLKKVGSFYNAVKFLEDLAKSVTWWQK